MTHRRAAAGGGTVVEVEPDRLAGWVTRFAARNAGLAELAATPEAVTLVGGDGATAILAVPLAPMALGDREPLEALLQHVAALGEIGLVLVRGGAHSIGRAARGAVLESSTDRPYLSGRTAAGGWSQQRYARRRGNQLAYSLHSAADLVARIVVPRAGHLDGLVVGGDRAAIAAVLGDPRLHPLLDLPRRVFPDIAEPRRAVLDEIAARALAVEITIRRAP